MNSEPVSPEPPPVLEDIRAARPYLFTRSPLKTFARRAGSIAVLVVIDLSGLVIGLYLALALRSLLFDPKPVLWNLLWQHETDWLPFLTLMLILVFWRNHLYGPRELLRRRLIPPEVVLGHPGFLHACDGIRLPGEHQLFNYAADLGRCEDGRLVVLADRTQAPSGSGYAMENRLVCQRVLPTLYDTRTKLARNLMHFIAFTAAGEAQRLAVVVHLAGRRDGDRGGGSGRHHIRAGTSMPIRPRAAVSCRR